MLAGVQPAPASTAERTLRASRLFGRLGDGDLRPFAAAATRKRLSAGDVLWREGKRAVSFTVIAQGLVEIVRRGADGSSSILAIFGPRESIGDAAALGGGAYPADAFALGDVEVLLVPAPLVIEAMRSRPEVALAVNGALLDHTRALHDKIRIMTAGSVPKRLATLLLHLVERFGDEAEDGATRVPVSLSRAELARLVGATVETTIRTMSRWQKDGLVTTTVGGFVVPDVSALTALTAELRDDA